MNTVQQTIPTTDHTAARAFLARLEARLRLEVLPDSSAHAIEEPYPKEPLGLGLFKHYPTTDRDWAYLACDYDERKPATYRGLVLDVFKAHQRPRRYRFNSGEFERDMTRVRRFLVVTLDMPDDFSRASSVGDYVIDRNRGDWRATEDRPVGMGPELRTLAGLDAS